MNASLTQTATWSGSLVASLAAHASVVAFVMATLDPRPTADTPLPKSELRVETQEVAHSTAAAAKADGPQAAAASAKGSELSEGVVPTSRASASVPRQDRVAATPAAAPLTKAASVPAQKLAASAAPRATKAATLPPATALKPAMAAQTATTSALPQATALKPAATPATMTQAAALTPVAARPLDLSAPTLAPAPDTAIQLALTDPDAAPAPEVTPDLSPAAAAAADGEHMVAALAFSGPDAQIDPASLTAIASFMRPGDTAARSDDTHDALTAILTSVPCARLQAEFNPETGSLDLRGHVPDPALKGPVLAALQAQLGGSIRVNDAMLILPRPQCGALSGISEVGLPQSQDQLTNPRLIGADAQARAYSYIKGESLVLDLAAPDYDAYVYVDFFAADGTVIHLVPNDTVPLRLRPAKSAMRVGAPDGDEPFLNITIGPPYGQEIAAAFAASSPLYDGLRPLSEPAAPYLDWLQTQVATARAQNPDFKGEWVYFFVATRE